MPLPRALLLLLLLACRRDGPGKPDAVSKPANEARPSKKMPVLGDGSGRRDPEEVPRDRPETVVFIVMDTVRADHTSLCGYNRPTTPFLAHLRDVFEVAWTCQAYSPATWTMPSHAAYFTGQGIPQHGHDRLGLSLPATTGPMLAEIMKERGYQTIMFAANTALEKSGLQRGFDQVRISKDMTELRHPQFAEELGEELAKADKGKPWFVFINLIDAHDPYPKIPDDTKWVPEQGTIALNVRKEGEDTRYHDFLRGAMPTDKAQKYLELITNGYDYGVWMEDENIHATFQVLRTVGRVPGPLRVVITADHGEFLGEHGLLRHAAYTWEPVVKVPFLYYDNLADKQITLPEPLAALSSFYLVRDGKLPDPALPVVSWSRVMDDRPIKPGEDMMARWAAGQPKLLWWNQGVNSFDLVADPDELRPLDAATHPIRSDFDQQVEVYRQHLERTNALPLDPETVQSLRELGYLH